MFNRTIEMLANPPITLHIANQFRCTWLLIFNHFEIKIYVQELFALFDIIETHVHTMCTLIPSSKEHGCWSNSAGQNYNVCLKICHKTYHIIYGMIWCLIRWYYTILGIERRLSIPYGIETAYIQILSYR